MAISDPRDIPGLVMWLSADAISGVSVGADVTTWADQSGNGNNGTLSNGGSGVYSATGGPSGGPAVTLNGAGRYILPNGLMAGAAAGEAFLGLKATNQSGGTWSISPGGSLASHYPHSTGYYENFGLQSSRPRITTQTTFATSWQNLNMWSAASDFSVTVDPAAISYTSASQGAVGWNTGTCLVFSNGTNNIAGAAAYVILFNRKLTTTERADLKTWLSANPSGGTPGAGPAPTTGTLTISAPPPVLAVSGDYAAPPATGTLTLSAPLPALSLTGDVLSAATGMLGLTAPVPTLSIAGTVAGAAITGTLGLATPPPAVVLTGTVSGVDTDLTYSNDGYGYAGIARVVYDPPVAEPAATIQRTKVKRVHQSLPAPTLVNGRPT